MHCKRNQSIRNPRRRLLMRAGWAWLVVAITLLAGPRTPSTPREASKSRTRSGFQRPWTLSTTANGCGRPWMGCRLLPDYVVYISPGFYYCLSSILYVPDQGHSDR